MSRVASIYVQSLFAGQLEENDEGYRFQYDARYLENPDAVAASLTLPLQKAPYLSATLFSFFDGLIPEGWLLEEVLRNWKLASDDRFGMLLAACYDCIGDVSIRGEAK